MRSILTNLFISIFTNPITLIFITITIIYSIINIIKNNRVYNFVFNKLHELKRGDGNLLNIANERYDLYKKDFPNSNLNISTFTEEIISELSYGNKEVVNEINSIKNAPSLCILLGVLGTFVGLTITLVSIDKNEIIKSMTLAIGSMQIAFATSIVGIICSIIINAFIKHKNCENILLQLMLKLENIMTIKSSTNKDYILDSKLDEIKVCIREITKSISAIERFDKISKDLHDFNDDFISSIEKLGNMLDGSNDSIKSFDQSIRKLDKQFNILNLKFVKLFDTYESQSEAYFEIVENIKKSSQDIKSVNQSQISIKDYIKSINATFAMYESNLQELMIRLISHEKNVLLKQKNINKNNQSLKEDIDKLTYVINKQSNSIIDELQLVFKYIDLYKEALEMSNLVSLKQDEYDLEKLENPNQTFDLDDDLFYEENENLKIENEEIDDEK